MIFEQVTDEGNITEERHFTIAILGVIRNESADDDDLAIVNQHGIVDRTLIGDEIGRFDARRRLHDGRDFLIDLQFHRAALGHLRCHPQGQANILAFDGLKRIGRCVGGLRKAAGNERNVLADNNFRFFVIQRENIRRR